MNEHETLHPTPEGDSTPAVEKKELQPNIYTGPTAPSDEPNEEYPQEPREGLTFRWWPLAIAAGLILSGYATDWSFYLFLSIVVIIHELGHVVMGKSFGCVIKEMQVFFLSFISYKPKQAEGSDGNSWRDITWSLGVLPFGGFTMFKLRPREDITTDAPALPPVEAQSPYLDDKPAWQRLLISAGGVLFNLATFLILYFAAPYLPLDWYRPCWAIESLSLILAVLNILPIYPLDGGAILFAAYEIMTGKKPSETFTNWCGIVGFVLIILFFWIFPEWIGGLIRKVFDVVY